MELDAIVLAQNDRAQIRIAGLPAHERAVRVARRVGATRVLVVEQPAELQDWRRGRTCPVLVIRADQLVHTPLVAPLVAAAPSPLAIAVGPDGAYGGAMLATGATADRLVERLAAGETDAAIAAEAETRVEHGAIARHAIDTPEARRGAHRLLYQILIKPQDNAITRYLYRPISSPLTKALAWTPITPNQISYLVAVLVALGCYLTAHGSMDRAIAGTATILVASYVDCCDGEIARLKLLSSKFGAWIDTVVDELSTLGYMVALGWHCHLAFGRDYFGDLGFDPWIAATVATSVLYVWCVYCIYYNIIVAVGSANSQDYVGRFDVAPGSAPGRVKLVAAAPTALAPKRPLPQPLQTLVTVLPYVVRRDFISWAALGFAITHLTHVSFGVQVAGTVVTFVVLTLDHLKLRALRRRVARAGQIVEPPSS